MPELKSEVKISLSNAIDIVLKPVATELVHDGDSGKSYDIVGNHPTYGLVRFSFESPTGAEPATCTNGTDVMIAGFDTDTSGMVLAEMVRPVETVVVRYEPCERDPEPRQLALDLSSTGEFIGA